MLPRRLRVLTAVVLTAAAVGMFNASNSSAQAMRADTVSPPVYDHIVVVVMENHTSDQIVGNRRAPFLNSLMKRGLNLTNYYGVTNPSQPNYVALFAGSTLGVTNDACPLKLSGPNLASELRASGRSFVGYSEGLPSAGSKVCWKGAYARKHNPWVNFAPLPPWVNQPFTAFPTDYSKLPTVSFVVPNLINDMHDGTVAPGDTWLSRHLGKYATWAATNRSLLIVTWDEGNLDDNHIATLVVGAGIAPSTSNRRFTHYSMLRSIEDVYGLPRLRKSATATPVPFG